MRSKKIFLRFPIIISFILLIAALTGITVLTKSMASNGSAFTGNDSRAYVAVIGKSSTSAFWESVSSGARASAAEYNLDMTFEAPESEEDYETQNEMIRSAVENGASAIVFSAIDYNANADAINEAIEAGVQVVIIDSDVNCENVACRIMTDNYAAGQMAGQKALENATSDLIVGIVNYDINSANGQQREQGFCDAITSSGRVHSIYSINCLSTEESAYEGTTELLEAHPDINTIAALNELMSLGSGYAIRDLGLEDSISIYAFDSNVVSVGMLETGEIDGLIVQNPFAMGYLGVETAYKLINGIAIESDHLNTTTTYVSLDNMYDIDIQRMIFRFGE